jgi:hypothetical protein
MQTQGRPHPAVTFFYRLLGAAIVIVGVGVAALAVQRIIPLAGPPSFTTRGARAMADAIAQLFWGLVVLVSGCYIWRAGRRRGLKDRLGRVLLIVGYCVIAVAFSQFVHASFELWRGVGGLSEKETFAPLVAFLVIGGPGALVAEIGRRMSDERFLLTASVEARST